MSEDYVTYLPRTIELDDGSRIILTEDEVLRGILRLYVPPSLIDKLNDYLRKKGFSNAIPSLPKGEKYNLSKIIEPPWELHIRIYPNGFIEAEVEVSRDYFEHLSSEYRVPVIYEAYEYYREFYNELHIYDTSRKRWVVKVIDHYQIALRHPENLTPWKPVTITAVIIALLGLSAYALASLSKPKSE